ncbi:hypothetical protein POM88_006055 [Heracleum sosnowskyi]|uniref:Retrovirus-related Pol polyprotein from transposon TNT 1-94-like beta-barrel domain-containing protein n=1 Tax=Heracleum sosnowskyi TaxID=360622 RepID=A0AAD8J589_9APIA|nr:hypothetical protein POM88_006055 [Heracleum sosnowskyi]
MHYKATTKLEEECFKSKQQAASRDKNKAKAQINWSDEEINSNEDSNEDMLNFALVGIDDDMVRGNTEEVHVNSDVSHSDFDVESSAVNSFQFNISSENVILESLTMQEHSNISIVEFMELKNEKNELEKKNASLRKMISELMAEKTPSNNHEDLISDLKGKLTQLEGFNKLLLKRNDTLMKELSELRAEIEARDVCLQTFKIRESISIEATQQAEKIKELESEVVKLEKGMGKFIQGEEVLKTIMKQTKVPMDKEGLGMASTSKSKAFQYEGKQVKVNANQWILDSGCTRHMCGDKSQFLSLKMKKGGSVTIGDNKTLRILGKGTIGNSNISIDKWSLEILAFDFMLIMITPKSPIGNWDVSLFPMSILMVSNAKYTSTSPF